MNLKRITSAVAALVMSVSMLAACGTKEPAVSSVVSNTNEPKAVVNLAMLKGPTGIGSVKLLQNADSNTALNDYKYTIAAGPDEISPKLLNGTYDIAALPTNVAAMLYNNSKGKVKIIAINTLSVLYVLEKGNTVTDIASLKGKTIHISGQGATPEYAIRALLSKNGLDPDKDVTLKFYANHAELAAQATAGKVDICVLPEPNVTAVMLKNKDMRVALDVNAVWKAAYGDDTALAMGCVVARTEFIEKNAAAVDKFLEEYAQSVSYVNENVDGAAELAANYGLVGAAAAGKQAIPRCNIVCVSGADMKPLIEPYFNVLKQYNEKSIGGQLPDDSFYYAK